MKAGKLILFVLLPLVVFAFAYFAFRPSNEPTYQDKTITLWLDDFASSFYAVGRQSTPNLQNQARAAFKALGPEAMPFIVERLEEADSPLHQFYKKAHPKHPLWLARILPGPKPDFNGTMGGSIFLSMGKSVEPKVSLLLGNRSHTVREAAAQGLYDLQLNSIDTRSAVSALAQALGDTDANVRFYCAADLGRIGSDASNAVGALTMCLKDPWVNPYGGIDVRLVAAEALGEIGPSSKDALPALMPLLKDRNSNLRVASAIAIWQITSDVSNALPTLIQAMNESRVTIFEIAPTLGEMGPNAKDAVPALLEYLQQRGSARAGRSGAEYQGALKALRNIDPSAAAHMDGDYRNLPIVQ